MYVLFIYFFLYSFTSTTSAIQLLSWGMDWLPKKHNPSPSPDRTVGGEKEPMVVRRPVCESVSHAVTECNTME